MHRGFYASQQKYTTEHLLEIKAYKEMSIKTVFLFIYVQTLFICSKVFQRAQAWLEFSNS